MRARTLLFILSLLLLAAALTYGWFHAMSELEARYNAWQSAEIAKGSTLGGQVKREGFPFTARLRIENFAYEKPGSFKITTDHLKVGLPILLPFELAITSTTPTKLILTKADYSATLSSLSLIWVTPWHAAQDADDTSLKLHVSLKDVWLDEKHHMALGNLVQEVTFRAAVLGPLPDFTNAAALDAWRDAGGRIDLTGVRFGWAALTAEGKGKLTLDKSRQPLATLDASISGYEQTVDTMRDQNQLQPLAVSLIKAAFRLLEDKNSGADKASAEPKKIHAPLAVQDNSLSVAGIPLLKWDPFSWP